MSERVSVLLRRAATALGEAYSRASAEQRQTLTLLQVDVLDVLAENGGQSRQQIEKLTGIDRSTVFTLTKRLADKKLVKECASDQKTPGKTGRKPALIDITLAGYEALLEARVARQAAEAKILGRMNLTAANRMLRGLALAISEDQS